MINAGCYLIPTDLFQKQEINRNFSWRKLISALVKKRTFVKSEGFLLILVYQDY